MGKNDRKKIENVDQFVHLGIGFLGMLYICLFTSRDMGYLTFYYQGCGIFETQFGTFMDIKLDKVPSGARIPRPALPPLFKEHKVCSFDSGDGSCMLYVIT